ncbi:MAG: hypothetical protein CL489_10620 [Acidobacteria bacterium]|nr:hypothetical protein [Acidobacteriota bacterium]|tara:strand:+ start:1523 stop:1747 length:225 start_codon:yes stop_codon:yes gene_type:complete
MPEFKHGCKVRLLREDVWIAGTPPVGTVGKLYRNPKHNRYWIFVPDDPKYNPKDGHHYGFIYPTDEDLEVIEDE